MYPYIFTYIVILTGILYFFVWIWITVKCPEGMLLIFLIGSDYRHWIFWVFVYLGMATFLVCSWRVVLLDVEFLVTGPFLSAQWTCHPSAFWPLWSDEKSAVIWMGNPCTRWVTLLLLLSKNFMSASASRNRRRTPITPSLAGPYPTHSCWTDPATVLADLRHTTFLWLLSYIHNNFFLSTIFSKISSNLSDFPNSLLL